MNLKKVYIHGLYLGFLWGESSSSALLANDGHGDPRMPLANDTLELRDDAKEGHGEPWTAASVDACDLREDLLDEAKEGQGEPWMEASVGACDLTEDLRDESKDGHDEPWTAALLSYDWRDTAEAAAVDEVDGVSKPSEIQNNKI